MPEIFILCEFASLNGGERSMLATLNGVQGAGFTPVVIAPPTGPLADRLATRRIELLPFRYANDTGIRLPQQRLREQLADLLHRRRPMLLHANSLATGRLSGPVAAELGLPSIAHLRDIVRLGRQATADLNRHSRLLAVSEAVRKFHIVGGLEAEKTHVLYNGVDLDEFRPRRPTGRLHQELSLPTDAQLVGTIGQISLRKGQDVLLQAATIIAVQCPTLHYLLVGRRYSDKEESRHFEQQLHELSKGLAGRVHFLGTRDDVAELLGELTMLAHPARQEPLGRVLLEAAAAGLPIVATDSGGTPEIFPPGSDAARLVPPDDPQVLAAAILELSSNRQLRDRLGAAARERAWRHFDVRTASAALVEHYRAAVG